MIERVVYQCEHCQIHKAKPKIYFKKETMETHEKNCLYNVENRTCCTCIHNDFYSDNYVDPQGKQEFGYANHCSNKDVIAAGGYKAKNPRFDCENWSDEPEEDDY